MPKRSRSRAPESGTGGLLRAPGVRRTPKRLSAVPQCSAASRVRVVTLLEYWKTGVVHFLVQEQDVGARREDRRKRRHAGDARPEVRARSETVPAGVLRRPVRGTARDRCARLRAHVHGRCPPWRDRFAAARIPRCKSACSTQAGTSGRSRKIPLVQIGVTGHQLNFLRPRSAIGAQKHGVCSSRKTWWLCDQRRAARSSDRIRRRADDGPTSSLPSSIDTWTK